MAPEYLRCGNFSIKSDVFSFGVLILEIVSGQKNTSFSNGENMEGFISFVSINIHMLNQSFPRNSILVKYTKLKAGLIKPYL